MILERISAESRNAFDFVRKVGVIRCEKFLIIAIRHDRADHSVKLFPVERRSLLDPDELTMQAHHRRLANAEMQIRPALSHEHREK